MGRLYSKTNKKVEDRDDGSITMVTMPEREQRDAAQDT